MIPLSTFLLSCLGFIGLQRLPVTLARLRCFSIFECEYTVRKGSECVDGYCTNPYHVGGCLANQLQGRNKVRTCHSDDPPSAVEKGYCRPSSLGYHEVRVASQNWESAIFTAWILQIVLSEFLEVPVSIESGKADAKIDFYDLNTSFDYGAGNDWDAVRRASEVKDCRKLSDSDEYLSCSHVVPEVWKGHMTILNKMKQDQLIESPGALGALAMQMWFMRRKTASRYPSLPTYIGLQGEENRRLVATVFKRPTTWNDYCAFISVDNCTTPDIYSNRAPAIDGEGSKYYVQGAYTGYFRATEQNDCDNNTACTGHILDYPCDWVSFIPQQTHHLGIPLESNGNEPGGGYTYSEMIQVWNAANATDSDVIMVWWKPESLYQQYLGTDSEFLPVTLPPETQDCLDHRSDPANRCGNVPELKFGDPLGACSEGPESLQKVVSSALLEISFEPNKPEALHSPAYDTIKNFRVSELQIGKIFEYWFQRDFDKYGLDPRDATCQWVVENIDILLPMIPRSHPRTIKDDVDAYKEPLFYGAIALACVAIFGTLCGSLLVALQHDKPAIRYAQIEFLFLVLIGLLLVSIGSLLTALPPSDRICVAIGWLVNLGYTLELVPLIVKLAAINQLTVASQQMRRVKLRMASLFSAVVFFFLLVGAWLIVWTLIDPPQKMEDLELTDEQSENDGIVINRVFYCSSDNEVWNFIGLSWQALLLLIASIMAFQIRKVRQDINDTKTLAVMIYSQTILVVLRAITYLLDGSLGYANVSAARSVIFSIDALTTLVIYFVPKFVQKEHSVNTQTLSNVAALGELEQPRRLTVHSWKSREPLGHGIAHSGKTQSDSTGGSRGMLSNKGQNSIRQGTVDYKTDTEWETPDAGVVLHAVSEANESVEELDDKDGTDSQ